MTVGKELFGEGKHVEFKAEIPDKHEKFLKDIIAFSNSSGGKVILGVEDETGIITGIGEQTPFKLSDSISNMIDDACFPQIYTDITPRSIEDKTILEIEVYPGKQRPYYLKRKGKEKSAYIRVNGTSRPASERKLKELEMEGMRVSFDTLPEIGADYDRQSALALCERMYQTALSACKTQEERDAVPPMTLEKLEDFGVLRKDGRKYQVTHAYMLLTNPTERYLKIQCALFKGVERVEFIDRKEFRGPIQEQLEEAYQFVLRHINMGAEIDGLFRRDVYELPARSIREMIINAVLHRSYLDEASIQVSIYDDRLEIDSPGMLYDGLSVSEALSGKSRCRNTAIAEAFQYMKLIEAWGTGLPRLYRSCREMGLKEPVFEEFGDGIKVIIFRKQVSGGKNGGNPDANGDNLAAIGGKYAQNGGDSELIGGNNEETTEVKDLQGNNILTIIIGEMKKDPSVTVKAISEKHVLSQRTVERAVKRLRENGTIVRHGATHGGYWEICWK